MGRSPCCDKVGLKKGPWTPEEDQKLLAYIEVHGHGSWRALPSKAGLQRCGKSCRLRWTNYLRSDIKRGKFTLEEEQTIIQLHALLGNRWSAIATHLPKRTDNEIKNYWNTHLKKRLTKMGIDPVTHKPKNATLLSNDGHSKSVAKLSHMAQWESARLEAEARLVRESKLRSHSLNHHQLGSSGIPSSLASVLNKPESPMKGLTNGGWLKSNEGNGGIATEISGDIESPSSTLSFSENNGLQIMSTSGLGEHAVPMVEFMGCSGSSSETGIALKEEEFEQEWKGYECSTNVPEYKESMENSMPYASSLHELTTMNMENKWGSESLKTSTCAHVPVGDAIAEVGFSNLLLNGNSDDRSNLSTEDVGDSNACDESGSGSGSDLYEDNKNYWNSILNLVNSSPSDSPMF